MIQLCKKIIRVFLRNLFCITKTWKYVTIIRRTNLVAYLKHHFLLRQIYINKQGKLALPVINFFLSHKCNLKCEYCEYFNPFRNKIPSKEELLNSIEVWSKKIEPQRIIIGGGEPLLNPDYEEIVLATRKTWKNAVIDIISNGLLILKVRDSFLVTMAEQKIGFRISRHLKTEQYTENLNKSIQRFKKLGIDYEIIESFDAWVTCHELDDYSVPKPSKSNPQTAWSQCLAKYCTSINGRELYRCSTLMNIRLAVKEGVLSSIWNNAVTHEGISVNQSVKKLLEYMKNGVMKECSVCPDKIVSVPSRQMRSDELQIYKQILSGQINNSNNENTRSAG
jgi:organic radical activating enzyme